MRTMQRAGPGLSDAAYTEMPGDSGWFSNYSAKRATIIREISVDLEKNGQEISSKYTFGQGNTGMSREVYCAAWFIMGDLLSTGRTLPELARIPEAMVATIRAAIDGR
jgi:hypothetical protein